MGYGLMVYSVNIDKVRGVCGSGDDSLRHSICGRFEQDIESTNDQLYYSNERGEPSVFLAIQHLIMGENKTLEGALYGYGLKYIVQYFGEFLDNNLFCPCSFDFLEDIDFQLGNAKATIKLSDLAFRSIMPELPSPNDFPLSGHWTAPAIADNLAAIAAYPKKTEELEAIQQWLEFANSRNEAIVGYFH